MDNFRPAGQRSILALKKKYRGLKSITHSEIMPTSKPRYGHGAVEMSHPQSGRPEALRCGFLEEAPCTAKAFSDLTFMVIGRPCRSIPNPGQGRYYS